MVIHMEYFNRSTKYVSNIFISNLQMFEGISFATGRDNNIVREKNVRVLRYPHGLISNEANFKNCPLQCRLNLTATILNCFIYTTVKI